MTKIQPSLKAASEDKTDDTISKATPSFWVDPSTIVVQPGFNARPIDPEWVSHLKQLRKNGVDTGDLLLQMINGERVLRDGHHRHLAVMELIAEGVAIKRVRAQEFKGDEKAAIYAMMATQSGKQYSPLELGGQYAKLINTFGDSFAEIAKMRGRSVQHVKDCIRLTEQSIEVKDAIASGAVTATTAMKAIKKDGAAAAGKTIKAGIVAAKAAGKTKLTQKTIDKLGARYVKEAVGGAKAAREHLTMMLDSPSFGNVTKARITDVLELVSGKTKQIVVKHGDDSDLAIIRAWLHGNIASGNSTISEAAKIMQNAANGEVIPSGPSPEARAYAHMVWLNDIVSENRNPTMREAARWFLAVIDSCRANREVAPPPSCLSLADAVQAEMDSDGAARAENLCPESVDLINYLRSAK